MSAELPEEAHEVYTVPEHMLVTGCRCMFPFSHDSVTDVSIYSGQ